MIQASQCSGLHAVLCINDTTGLDWGYSRDSSAYFDVPNGGIVLFSLLQEVEGVTVIPFAEPVFGS